MNPEQHSEEGGKAKLIVSALASAGFILLFVLILWLTYLPTHSSDVDETTRMEQEGKLVELKAENTAAIENYAVLNPAEGVYRIPVDEAMEKTVAAYREN